MKRIELLSQPPGFDFLGSPSCQRGGPTSPERERGDHRHARHTISGWHNLMMKMGS